MGESAFDLGDVTVDEVARGKLRVAQPRRGYRFNIDALILADFVSRGSSCAPDVVVDLGCGCGIVGLLLVQRWACCKGVLVELQPALARLARFNVLENALSGRVRVVCADLREVGQWAAGAHERVVVVSNPPFYPLGAGRSSSDPMVATAKHEVECRFDQLALACQDGLAAGQTLALIHDARRREEVALTLRERGLSICRERLVLPLPGRGPRRVLFEAVRRSRADSRRPRPIVEAPLVIHEEPGVYSCELGWILGEARSGAQRGNHGSRLSPREKIQ